MTTVVPTSEDDPCLSVVRFTSEIAWADAGPEVAEPQVERLCAEAQECMFRGRWLDLVSLMLTSADVIFSKVAEKDLECIFTVICNVVSSSGDPDEVLEMAKLISGKIVQQPADKPLLRLKILFNLYNLVNIPYGRFLVYTKVLDLAIHGKVTESVVSSFKKIDSFLKEWNIGIKDQRELFLSVSNVLRESKSSAKESFLFLTKYLGTFTDEEAHGLIEAKEEAVRAIVEFVKAPDIYQCDLLEMPAVKQLENDSQHNLAYVLLKIFLTQRLESYLEFHASNAEILKSYGLVHDDCVSKMRLMSLLDLGSGESGQIPYALIKDTLQVNHDEVETWVVKAISAKLLDCKMDELTEVVIVSRCTGRTFGRYHWEVLRAKLATWRGNIAGVISTIQANKVTEEASQAIQSR
ncbi:hypothetical protein MLD38_033864 [Melastoma candidum]|uniref:Uncharacterized protein n=1 Tax=Melastoma candidum TaxID=119954 RepID=A0ACB9MCH6_9MYRT|nr:hypothetical protein MLD38_033864 [Melastoma candidum]